MLYTKEMMEEQTTDLADWQKEVYEHFSIMMTSKDNAYPCVPGVQGFVKNMLRFGFVEDPRTDSSADGLACLLKEYGNISRETGNYASLVVFCDTRSLIEEEAAIEDYEEIFWALLNATHRLDEAEWPKDIPMDPENQSWEFCYNGEPYFAFCATPAHKVRKSRGFPCLLLAFQPRWVFDEINASTSLGKKLKNIIRKRLVTYDDMPPHPALKWYGQEDNYEWKQYFLHDDDTSIPQCPFMALKKRLKSLRP
ncbi:YqcI/YcgG family protein [Halobacillus litoralis]|uniref:YqcI/YcgG family protein n=1 Tax=Halobacillus litoralis TaxID=45668 RepID=UPI001CFCBA66|nr:YqcI/YcgG family protein [Halobacillus litoralis]